MKKLLALIMAMALLLCFVGCGEKGKTDSKPEVTKKEAVVVGYSSCEPVIYELFADGKKQLGGFDCDLAKKIFEGLNMEPTFKEIKSEDVYTELENGNIDCYFGGFVSNIADMDGVSRSNKVDFSHNYMKTQQVMIAKINNGMENIAVLKGKKGVVQGGTSGEIFAKKYRATDNQNFTLNIESVDTYADCIAAINTGTAHFAIVDIHAANIYCGGGDGIEIFSTIKGDTEYFAAAFKKGSELKEKVNAELEKLAKDGSITEIAKKYNAADYVITDFSSQK